MQDPDELAAPSTRQATARVGGTRKVGSARLNLIPVDAQRLFVHWFIPAQQLRDALLGIQGQRAGARLRLRIFDIPASQPAAIGAGAPRQEYPAGGGWHEGFITLDRPGGAVVAALGIQDGQGQFSALLTSLVVTLPDAATASALEPAKAPTKSPDPALPHERRRTTVGESKRLAVVDSRKGGAKPSLERVLARVAQPVPPVPAVDAPKPSDAGDTETIEAPSAVDAPSPIPKAPEPTVQETTVPTLENAETQASPVSSVSAVESPVTPTVEARHDRGESYLPSEPAPSFDAPQPSGDPEKAERTPDETPERYASFFESARSDAGPFLLARIVVAGHIAEGFRVRLGPEPIVPAPGGAFTVIRPIEGTESAWSLLRHAASLPHSLDQPSLAVLAAEAERDAVLSLHTSIEVEGRLADPAHAFVLPAGVTADERGAFRFARALPTGAWFPPDLVVTVASTHG
jgi:hypothetical protein